LLGFFETASLCTPSRSGTFDTPVSSSLVLGLQKHTPHRLKTYFSKVTLASMDRIEMIRQFAETGRLL
jgi:hypothetical protein